MYAKALPDFITAWREQDNRYGRRKKETGDGMHQGEISMR